MGIRGVPMDKNLMIAAIRDRRGILTQTAKLLNCDPQTLYEWMEKDEDVANAVKEARANNEKNRMNYDDEFIESAYESMRYHLQRKDIKATLFTLESKAGWKTNGNMNHQFITNIIERPYQAKADTDTPQVPL